MRLNATIVVGNDLFYDLACRARRCAARSAHGRNVMSGWDVHASSSRAPSAGARFYAPRAGVLINGRMVARRACHDTLPRKRAVAAIHGSLAPPQSIIPDMH